MIRMEEEYGNAQQKNKANAQLPYNSRAHLFCWDASASPTNPILPSITIVLNSLPFSNDNSDN